jgi:hypothetical protein
MHGPAVLNATFVLSDGSTLSAAAIFDIYSRGGPSGFNEFLARERMSMQGFARVLGHMEQTGLSRVDLRPSAALRTQLDLSRGLDPVRVTEARDTFEALASKSLGTLRTDAADLSPTRSLGERILDTLAEFFARLISLGFWNVRTETWEGARIDDSAASTYARTLAQTHGALLRTLMEQPDGRAALERALLAQTPDNVPAATWANVTARLLHHLDSELPRVSAPSLSAVEAQGLADFVAAHPNRHDVTSLVLRERTPQLAARGIILERLASLDEAALTQLSHWLETPATSDAARRFQALESTGQQLVMQAVSHADFSVSDARFLEIVTGAERIPALRLSEPQQHALLRAAAGAELDRIHFFTGEGVGLIDRLAGLSSPMRDAFLARAADAAESADNLLVLMSGDTELAGLADARKTTLTAAERARAVRVFERSQLSLSFSPQLIVTARGPEGTTNGVRIVSLERLLGNATARRAFCREQHLDEADFTRMVWSLARAAESEGSEETARTARQDRTALAITLAQGIEYDATGESVTLSGDRRLEIEAQMRSLDLTVARSSGLRVRSFDVSREGTLASAFGLYDGRTDTRAAITARTSHGVSLSSVATGGFTHSSFASTATTLAAVAPSTFFQSATFNYRFDGSGRLLAGGYIASGAVVDRILRSREAPSVARVLDAYGSLDSSAGASEAGVSFGDTSAMRALDPANVRVITFTGAGGSIDGRVFERSSQRFAESWRRGAGVSPAHTMHLATPRREDLLRTIDAQIDAMQEGQGLVLYYAGHNYTDNATNGITGLKLAGGEFLEPEFMRAIAERCAARHINLFWLPDTCRSESFVRPIVDENRTVRSAHGTWTQEQAMLLQMQTGLQAYFTASSSIANTRERDLGTIATLFGETAFATNAQLTTLARRALAVPLGTEDEAAHLTLTGLSDLMVERGRLEALRDRNEARAEALRSELAAFHGTRAARARLQLELSNITRSEGLIDARIASVDDLINAVVSIRRARKDLPPSAVRDDAILTGGATMPTTRTDAERQLVALADAIAFRLAAA